MRKLGDLTLREIRETCFKHNRICSEHPEFPTNACEACTLYDPEVHDACLRFLESTPDTWSNYKLENF